MTWLSKPFVFAICFCMWISFCFEASALSLLQNSSRRTKRSEEAQTCLQSRNQCNGNNTCKKALRNVNQKCTQTQGRCEAELLDIDDCVEDLETIWSIAFLTEPRCTCIGHQLKGRKFMKCIEIYNLVHVNPCYDKGKMLSRQTQPQSTTAAAQNIASSAIDTKMIPDSLHELDTTEANQLQSSSTLATIVEKTFSEVTPSSKTSTDKNSSQALSCSGKLLITGGVFLFVILFMLIGAFIYFRRRRHSGYTKGTGLKKSSLYSYITYKKNSDNKENGKMNK